MLGKSFQWADDIKLSNWLIELWCCLSFKLCCYAVSSKRLLSSLVALLGAPGASHSCLVSSQFKPFKFTCVKITLVWAKPLNTLTNGPLLKVDAFLLLP